ncbi:molybdopterin synthase catalytic subunit MoaE [Pseudohaliea rubra]|uniref:Molybdopterin synthase catalytic subunit n=1 Tax=Pseudohaliea rubra DSM 19751 TaxID=1265313 RepID=A0A095VQ30_9GAMM|nr:molybdopterin synthase catalytic subunit MoaE [Pseudohaliea rubra]KGE03485.1 Molybdenum cofactor biosynthesis protein MoaE [Pseudohaliea rubra DSM 19751]
MGPRFCRIQREDFDPAALQAAVATGDSAGAVVTFTGQVRRPVGDDSFSGLTLEHYPGMTERAIAAILDEAGERWPLLAIGVVHRIGELAPGASIVWVGAAAAHRGDAFAACEFTMDYLKTRAPFWKKEYRGSGARWVEARRGDDERAARWQRAAPMTTARTED